MNSGPTAFKDLHPEFQELAREHSILRAHNRSFKPGDSQATLLLFAEGSLVLTMLERFLRMVLRADALNTDTLPTLLEKATSVRLNLLLLPHGTDRISFIKEVVDIRNALLHGNYEQAAALAGATSVGEYFRAEFSRDVERIYLVTEWFVHQVNPITGKRPGP